jgi:hypothetical protein
MFVKLEITKKCSEFEILFIAIYELIQFDTLLDV